METRKITVVSSRENKRSTIMSAATTLAELKADLQASGIDYTDMVFYEGISKVELLNDESLLPTNVMYKGTPTNDLVFMLTPQNKKIKSGCELVRSEIYKAIQEKGLQDKAVEKFGRNYTNCKTSELMTLLEEFKEEEPTIEDERLRKAFKSLVEELVKNDYISEVKGALIVSQLDGKVLESDYSETEIDEMFNFMH